MQQGKSRILVSVDTNHYAYFYDGKDGCWYGSYLTKEEVNNKKILYLVFFAVPFLMGILRWLDSQTKDMEVTSHLLLTGIFILGIFTVAYFGVRNAFFKGVEKRLDREQRLGNITEIEEFKLCVTGRNQLRKNIEWMALLITGMFFCVVIYMYFSFHLIWLVYALFQILLCAFHFTYQPLRCHMILSSVLNKGRKR